MFIMGADDGDADDEICMSCHRIDGFCRTRQRHSSDWLSSMTQ